MQTYSSRILRRHALRLKNETKLGTEAAEGIAKIHARLKPNASLFQEMFSLWDADTPLPQTIKRFRQSVPDGNAKLLLDLKGALAKYKETVVWQPGVKENLVEAEKELDTQIKEVFALENMELQKLDWSWTPQKVFKRIMDLEAVHKYSGTEDMKQRVGGDGPGRAIYALFLKPTANNPKKFQIQRLYTEPIAFVHVALTNKVSDNVQVRMWLV